MPFTSISSVMSTHGLFIYYLFYEPVLQQVRNYKNKFVEVNHQQYNLLIISYTVSHIDLPVIYMEFCAYSIQASFKASL